MAQYFVDDLITAQTSLKNMNQYQQALALLEEINRELDNLVATGYRTETSEQKFIPFYQQFNKSCEQTMEGLRGIAQYVKGVGDGFGELDRTMGNNLTAG
ncbi:TIGR04197 family type VII secretion effector [Streptomyces sp. NPDC093252]|uniref:TIGR04197 family type VII secretion effector n=1 Tax=Streptomyces sp. NPDC093252 TaxID=3154980 RepID=UPI003422D2CF